MFTILRIFFSAKVANRPLVLACLLFAGLAEGIGLATLLPLLSTAAGGDGSSTLNRMVEGALGALGLTPDIGTMILIVVGGLVLKAALTILAMNYVGYAVAEVSTSLRERLIKALLNVRWSYLATQPLGRIANAVSLEATRSGETYLMAAQVIAYMIQAAIYIAVAFLVSWRLALVAVLVGFFITTALGALVRAAKRAGRKQTRRTEELVTYLSDALMGVKPLKAMGRQGRFANLFQDKIDALRLALRRQVISKEALKNLSDPLIAMFLGAGFFIATKWWSLQVSELIVMGLLMGQTVGRFSKIQQQLQRALILEAAYRTVNRIIDETEAELEPPSGGRAPTLKRSARLSGVSFAYGAKPVLKAADLEARQGELTVITGESGAGKTTLTDLLLGLQEPQAGEILVDDVPLPELHMDQWRAKVGYVPQELTLFNDTIRANVTLGDPRISDARAWEALEAAGARGFVEGLAEGLDAPVGERGLKLSGGQRQRIALARALSHDPELIILDEVTSALDPETERDICANIRALLGPVTVIAITHRAAWLEAADRIYHLDGQGRVTREPPPARLKAAAS